MRIAMLALVVACVVPRTATAGRTFYGWLYGPEVMPERGVELQTWVAEENDKYGTHGKESSIWWGPLVGVSDQLELSLPLEAVWAVADGAAPSFTFKRFGIEAHYRLVSQDPVEAPALAPLVRVAIKRDVTQRNDVRVEAGLVTAYEAGSVQVVADLGFVGELVPNRVHTEVHPALGVSVRVDGELRLGAEAYSELSLDSRGESWAVVGPNLSWTHGRFWVSGAFGVGVYHVGNAPRVVWGIAF